MRLNRGGSILLTIINQKIKIMRYYVSITETLNRVVSVDAENEEEAANKVSQAYHCEEIVLNSDDYLEDSAEVELECQDDYRKTEEYYGGDFYQHID